MEFWSVVRSSPELSHSDDLLDVTVQCNCDKITIHLGRTLTVPSSGG